MPTPTQSFVALAKLLVSGELNESIAVSLYRVFTGYCIGCVLGLGLGILTSTSKIAEFTITPILELLRPIPPVAFVPLAILWFGLGNGPALFLVAFASFFPTFTSTVSGINTVASNHIDAALTLGANKVQLIRYVLLPAAFPVIISGLKTSLGIAWFVLIVAELVGAQSGLGYFIQLNRLTLQSANVIAGMICIGILGFAMNYAFSYITRNLIKWA